MTYIIMNEEGSFNYLIPYHVKETQTMRVKKIYTFNEGDSILSEVVKSIACDSIENQDVKFNSVKNENNTFMLEIPKQLGKSHSIYNKFRTY